MNWNWNRKLHGEYRWPLACTFAAFSSIGFLSPVQAPHQAFFYMYVCHELAQLSHLFFDRKPSPTSSRQESPFHPPCNLMRTAQKDCSGHLLMASALVHQSQSKRLHKEEEDSTLTHLSDDDLLSFDGYERRLAFDLDPASPVIRYTPHPAFPFPLVLQWDFL